MTVLATWDIRSNTCALTMMSFTRCAGYLDHPFAKSVVVGRTISLCNPCTGYLGYPF